MSFKSFAANFADMRSIMCGNFSFHVARHLAALLVSMLGMMRAACDDSISARRSATASSSTWHSSLAQSSPMDAVIGVLVPGAGLQGMR